MLPANDNTPATREERQGVQTNILQSIVAPLNRINKTLTNLVTFITIEKNRQDLAAEEAKSEANGTGGKASNPIVAAARREQSKLDRMISAVASIGAPIVLGIYEYVKSISDQIPRMLTRAGDFFRHLGSTILNAVRPPLTAALNAVSEIFGPIFTPIFDMVRTFVTELVSMGQQLTHALLDFIGNHLSGRAREIFDSIRHFSISHTARRGQEIISNMTGGAIPPPAAPSNTPQQSEPVTTGSSTTALPSGMHARQIDHRPSANILDAIRQAASRVGVDFGIMMAMARQESSFNAGAAAGTSSARGLFQFTGRTWAGMVRDYGRQFPELTQNAIMNPFANALAGALYIRDNIRTLMRAHLPVHSGSVYTMHFMGPSGGVRLLRVADSQPDAIAATLFPQEARANRNIFYDRRSGQPRTTAQTRDFIFGLIMPYESAYRDAYAIGTATAAAGTGALQGAVQPSPPQTRVVRSTPAASPQINNRPPTVSGADHTAVRDQYIHRLGGH